MEVDNPKRASGKISVYTGCFSCSLFYHSSRIPQQVSEGLAFVTWASAGCGIYSSVYWLVRPAFVSQSSVLLL